MNMHLWEGVPAALSIPESREHIALKVAAHTAELLTSASRISDNMKGTHDEGGELWLRENHPQRPYKGG